MLYFLYSLNFESSKAVYKSCTKITYPVVAWSPSNTRINKLACSSMFSVIFNVNVISLLILTQLAFCSLFSGIFYINFNLFIRLLFSFLLTKFSWFGLSLIVVLRNEFFLQLNIWVESRKTRNTRFHPRQHIWSHVNDLVLFVKVVESRQLTNLASYMDFYLSIWTYIVVSSWPTWFVLL